MINYMKFIIPGRLHLANLHGSFLPAIVETSVKQVCKMMSEANKALVSVAGLGGR